MRNLLHSQPIYRSVATNNLEDGLDSRGTSPVDPFAIQKAHYLQPVRKTDSFDSLAHSNESTESYNKSFLKFDDSAEKRRERRKQSHKAMQHAQNKNPLTKDHYKKIKVENQKILRSMVVIEQGKELQVASHRLRSQDCQIKSLNYDRARQIA